MDANRIAFTGYEEGRIGIYFIESREALSGAVESTVAEDIPAAALLPPAMRTNELVSAALADATTGLPAAVADPTPTARGSA